jgi:aminoglycoside phosphotransferase (APT) family kinase protein
VPWIDSEGEVFGQPGMISSFCEGVARPPTEGLITTSTAGYGARYRKLLAPAFVGNLAKYHTFDWSKAELDSLDVPTAGTNEGVIWAINWWARVWEEDSLEANPLITVVTQWLRDNAPPIDHISLVHADYKGGNFLFDPKTAAVTAVLDWELVHLGDRHEDLSFALLPLNAEVDEAGETMVCGLCSKEYFLGEYQRLSGLSVDPKRLHYYQVFTAWRSAIISMSTAARCALDHKTHNSVLLCYSAYAASPLIAYFHTLLKEEL